MAKRAKLTSTPARMGLVLALVAGLLSTVFLATRGSEVGIARDEAIYFEASRRYGAYWAKVAQEPSQLGDVKSRDRHFVFNAEHPAMMKSLAGVSARFFAKAPALAPGAKADAWAPSGGLMPVMPERSAMRLPAQTLAGLGVLLLLFAAWADARRRSLSLAIAASAGLLAALSFITLPRVAFHASLHAFDVPIAVATLAVVLAYRRGLRSLRWACITGLLLGLAIAIKHNALFVGPLLALHYYFSLWRQRRAGRGPTKAQLFPPVLVACVLLAPLVVWVSWPWLWSQPLARLSNYFSFHAEHSYYNMEFLGANYNRPPLPIAYPFVMSALTLPLVWMGMALLGTSIPDPTPLARNKGGGQAPSSKIWRRGLWPASWPRHERGLYLCFGIFPLLLIALPSIPIFGGTKHWITAYPFWALLIARAWTGLAPLFETRRLWLWPALVLMVLPNVWATAHGHPYNLSQYAGWAGGARGAADDGFNRGFWGYAAAPLLKLEADPGARRKTVYTHDLHPLAAKQYQREGRWPALRPTGVRGSDVALIFHERHMLSEEVQVWREFESNAPADFVLLDDVPLTSLYLRPAKGTQP